jgi:hypothetical protein
VSPPLALENGGYVGAAYLVFLLVLLIYVAIMAGKLQRIQRGLRSLAELAESPEARRTGPGIEQARGREEEIEAVRQGGHR